MKNILTPLLTQNNFTLSPSLLDQVQTYLELIQEWNQHINLTAHRTVEEMIEKDILDCLYLNLYIKTYIKEVNNVLDMGAGAGFQGIILKLMNSTWNVSFLEANRKKMNFIREAYRKLGFVGADPCVRPRLALNQEKGGHMGPPLQQQFHQIRAESNPPALHEKFDLIVSRATWGQMDFLKNAHYYVQNKGWIVWMAGPGEKILSGDFYTQNNLLTHNKILYTIEPKKYQRQFFFFQKLFHVEQA